MDVCYPSAEVEWPGLVNALSGLVCAHLNDIGPHSTYQPNYSFQPQGAIIGNVCVSLLCHLLSITLHNQEMHLLLDCDMLPYLGRPFVLKTSLLGLSCCRVDLL